jgi:pre-mRNA-splicing factor ATP-dependent RNA helicase DHX16
VKAAEFVTDLEQWDSEQIAKAQLTSGAMDREVIEDTYDYVFDESVKIQFALDAEDRLEGTLGVKDTALQAQIEEAERRGVPCHLIR